MLNVDGRAYVDFEIKTQELVKKEDNKDDDKDGERRILKDVQEED